LIVIDASARLELLVQTKLAGRVMDRALVASESLHMRMTARMWRWQKHLMHRS